MTSRTARPPDADSVRFNVIGGYADVRAWIVQRPADSLQNQMFIVRSTGYAITPAAGAAPQGVHTVAQFAYWQSARIRRIAAFTAANGIHTGNAGTIVIGGQNSPSCGPGAIRSVRGAAGSTLSNGTYFPSNNIVSGTGFEVADTTGVRWYTMIAGGFTPTYTSIQPGLSSWESHFVQGNATLDTWGTGLLVVTGDLTTSGDWAGWRGIVLVGGRIIFDATFNWFTGMVITGLNERLGLPTAPDSLGASGKTYLVIYNSCDVDETLARLTGLVPVPNAYVDNWASY
jgi:hypothetical protein